MTSELRRMSAFLDELESHDLARATILESWARCAREGLDRDGTVRFRRVPPLELARRRDAASSLIRASERIMQELHASLPGESNVVYLTDADGIVLCVVGDPQRVAAWGLEPGHDWSEGTMGTNGAGTCLTTGRPVAVVGPAHFLTAFHDCTCTAAPIRGADRRIVGALDVSSTVADAAPSRIREVVAACERIEALL